LVDVEPSDRVWSEEVFGPVVCIRAFDEESEMLEEVNESPFALAASVWTRDLAKAIRVARRVEGGSISINSHEIQHLEAPFGGCKHSGMGREFGMAALENFTELKNVYVGE
jgi:betaine-aldehyde dehydrogenase